MKARRFRVLDYLAELQASQPRPHTSLTPEPRREDPPFVITQLQILRMASACLDAQTLADCLDRDVPVEEKRRVRHA